MTDRTLYVAGPATGARVQKDGEKWTLVLIRDFRHPPAKVWEALTDPAQLAAWAPFDADVSLGTAGTTAKLTWLGTQTTIETTVTQADAPNVLEYGDTRWELEAFAGGTRMTLWHRIDRRYVAWGATGWHICFEVLIQVLSGIAVARIAGGDAMKIPGWQRLRDEYSNQLGIESPHPKKAEN